MSFISYAQNFEDVMLWRALGTVERGFYVDVGANDPEIDSTTNAFYQRGWRGINIEPIAQWHRKLEQARPRDINLAVAAGAQSGEITLHELADTGLSTMIEAIAKRHEAIGFTRIERTVPVETLTSICLRFHVAPIHFLKIDVEGAEQAVLRGIDFALIRPWIIVIESTVPLSRTENFEEWENILEANGYRYTHFDGLNRFYVSPDHPELAQHFAVPPNVFDSFTFSGTASHTFCEALNSRITAAESSAAQQSERASRALEQLTQLQQQHAAQVAQHTAQIDQGAAQAEQHAAQIEQQQARIGELEAELHRTRQQLQAVDAERNALRTSWSWRATAPLRWGAGVALDKTPDLAKGGRQIVASAASAVQRPLTEAMRVVLRDPALAYRINQRILRYPALHRRLLGIARRAGVIPGEPVRTALHESGDGADYSSLTPRAREIHDRLAAALHERQKERA